MTIFKELDIGLSKKGLTVKQKELLLYLRDYIYTNKTWAGIKTIDKVVYIRQKGIKVAIEHFNTTYGSLFVTLNRASNTLYKLFGLDILTLILRGTDEDLTLATQRINQATKNGVLLKYLVVMDIAPHLKPTGSKRTYAISELKKELQFLYKLSTRRLLRELSTLDQDKLYYIVNEFEKQGDFHNAVTKVIDPEYSPRKN